MSHITMLQSRVEFGDAANFGFAADSAVPSGVSSPSVSDQMDPDQVVSPWDTFDLEDDDVLALPTAVAPAPPMMDEVRVNTRCLHGDGCPPVKRLRTTLADEPQHIDIQSSTTWVQRVKHVMWKVCGAEYLEGHKPIITESLCSGCGSASIALEAFCFNNLESHICLVILMMSVSVLRLSQDSGIQDCDCSCRGWVCEARSRALLAKVSPRLNAVCFAEKSARQVV